MEKWFHCDIVVEAGLTYYERPLPNLMTSSIAGNCPSFQKGVELVELTIDQPELVLMLMLLDELKVEPMELP